MKEANSCSILLSSSYQNIIKQQLALQKVAKLLKNNVKIDILFLIFDAVFIASNAIIFPAEEFNIVKQWQELIKQNSMNAHVCVNSALKRGVIDKAMANLYNKNVITLAAGFQLSTLGMYFESLGKVTQGFQL